MSYEYQDYIMTFTEWKPMVWKYQITAPDGTELEEGGDYIGTTIWNSGVFDEAETAVEYYLDYLEEDKQILENYED